MKKIYIVSGVNVIRWTQEDLEKEFKITKIKFATWENKTFEDFVAWKRGVYQYPYEVENEDLGYYTSFEQANDDVRHNFLDINDGGLYGFMVICTVSPNHLYPQMYDNDAWIYQYDFENNKYVPRRKSDKIEKEILRHFSIL